LNIRAKKIEKVNDGSGKMSDGYNKIETWDAKNVEELSSIYYRVLELIGEDPEREGLKRTPQRVAKALHFLTNGYNMDAEQILRSAMFKEEYKQMVIVH
jgi:GTP cyclohydrolase I